MKFLIITALKNVPIRKYEELANYINKIRNGDTDVLWLVK